MSAPRSAIDEMTAIPDYELSVEQLDEDIVEIAYARDHLSVLLARKARSQTERRGHDELGYPSPTAYLKDRGRMSTGHAQRVVSMANSIVKSLAVTQAWSDGRISTDQAGLLFALVEVMPGEFAEAQERLVEIVEPLSVSDTRRALEYWRQSVDGPGEISEETQLGRRGLSVSRTMGGMRRVDGWMTATAGQALETALAALTPPPAENDDRTPRQRRHDAMEDLARSFLDAIGPPTGATSTTSPIGPMEATPQYTAVSCAAATTTPRNTSDKPSPDAPHAADEPRGGPSPTTPDITSPDGQAGQICQTRVRTALPHR